MKQHQNDPDPEKPTKKKKMENDLEALKAETEKALERIEKTLKENGREVNDKDCLNCG